MIDQEYVHTIATLTGLIRAVTAVEHELDDARVHLAHIKATIATTGSHTMPSTDRDYVVPQPTQAQIDWQEALKAHRIATPRIGVTGWIGGGLEAREHPDESDTDL